MSSVRYQILQEILRTLRCDIQFVAQGADEIDTVDPDNIVFHKISQIELPQNRGFTMYNFPSIVVSCPYTEPINIAEGEVAHDVYRFKWLISIRVEDHYDPRLYLESVWKWQEDICRTFQYKTTWDNVDAEQVLSNSIMADPVDEKYWLDEEKIRANVLVETQAWQTREPPT